MFIEIPTRVVPASRESLEKFNHKDLRDYAKYLGIKPGHRKIDTIIFLMESGKATLCASLGN